MNTEELPPFQQEYSLDELCRMARISQTRLINETELNARTINKMRRGQPVSALKADIVCDVLSRHLKKLVSTENISTIILIKKK